MNYGGSGWFHRDFSQNQTGRIIRSHKAQLPVIVLVPKDQFSHGRVSGPLLLNQAEGTTWDQQSHSLTWADLWGATSGLLVLLAPHPWFHLFTGLLTLRISFCLCLPVKLKFPGTGSALPSLTLHYTSSNIQLWPSLCLLHARYPLSLTNLPPSYGFLICQSSPISVPALLISDKCW